MSDIKILSGGAANGLVNAVRSEFLAVTGHGIVVILARLGVCSIASWVVRLSIS